eukprot:Nitzschia sp. Nitz4//scaffold58_size112336//33270//33792//NITZ4_004024-RA/size112336-augustus-gene-0.3-mRNA-1//1//CDS//3329554962//6828//frame0
MTHAVQAFIAFLRCEAKLAEERAKSLRTTAAAIEANNNNITGRSKKRPRESSPVEPRKNHTAYSFFVNENLELLRKEQPELSSRELVAILARQWDVTSEEEKLVWKYRADQARPTEPLPHDDLLREELPLETHALEESHVVKIE